MEAEGWIVSVLVAAIVCFLVVVRFDFFIIFLAQFYHPPYAIQRPIGQSTDTKFYLSDLYKYLWLCVLRLDYGAVEKICSGLGHCHRNAGFSVRSNVGWGKAGEISLRVGGESRCGPATLSRRSEWRS